MSEVPSRKREQINESMAQSFSLAVLGGGLNFDAGFNEQIDSLRKEIDEKNDSILMLNKQVKELQERNEELTSTLESKDEEIKALKRKIGILENEKQALEKKLRSVEVELEAVGKKVIELKDANKVNEEKNVKMAENVKMLTKKVEVIKKSLDDSRDENTSLKKDLKNLREEVQRKPPFGVPGKMALPSTLTEALVDGASVVLGQMCTELQGLMYKKVHPNSYDPTKSYKVKIIEEDIDLLYKDEKQKNDARKRWEELRSKLHWNKARHKRAMKSIQEGRNFAAHPSLNEEKVVRSVALMKQEGKLTGWKKEEDVQELVEMWKTMQQD